MLDEGWAYLETWRSAGVGGVGDANAVAGEGGVGGVKADELGQARRAASAPEPLLVHVQYVFGPFKD